MQHQTGNDTVSRTGAARFLVAPRVTVAAVVVAILVGCTGGSGAEPDWGASNPEASRYLSGLWSSDLDEGYSIGRCADLRSMSVGEFHDDFMSQGIGQEYVQAGYGPDIDEDYLYDFFQRKCDTEGL